MSGNLFQGFADPVDPTAGWFTAHCDGGSRGNPGPAGFGAVIEDPQGRVAARLSEFLGKQTNNYAEYSGLVAVLKWASTHGLKRLRVVSDSELMVKQMKGQYKVTNPGLRPLWEEARRLARTFDVFEITHTLRAGNAEADRLANEAMDRGMGKNRDQGSATPSSKDRSPGTPAGIREQGSGTMQQARQGHGDQPTGGPQPARVPPAHPQRQVLEGYVKDGVVHLLEGELPDGIFVKVIRE
ncbi:MAG TPA: ribonuclease HI family protein [Terracidiphilus sp.]